MTRKQYPHVIKKLINEHKEILNVAGLEEKAGFPKNSLRKSLLGTRELTPLEAGKLAGILYGMGFYFSALNLSEKEIRDLPYR